MWNSSPLIPTFHTYAFEPHAILSGKKSFIINSLQSSFFFWHTSCPLVWQMTR
ncbi:hypothetical protein HMPREF9442_01119 [Paraprevotella xylaniphila YIT 11841]|uniref:Uncharacterized protein n=1 Tax=Paraprevotella xylaniphila YIT 11841 TaxID=762982 RepID=F3QSG1_9BACT|nr:hypothetical protein HMPREF9442_01119 [Paraprevotella xylaniphila YIT 11841]